MTDYGDSPSSGDDNDSRWYEAARERVRTPGTILQWFGLISVFLTVIGLVLVVAAPKLAFKGLYDLQADLNKNQPAQNQQPLPPFDEWVKTQQLTNGVAGVLQLVGSVLIFLGGAKMKALQSYGLALAGSILAIIPCNACCCIGAPFGIWALVVLLNADVKLAFTRTPDVSRDISPDSQME
jgi:hypothetical protein